MNWGVREYITRDRAAEAEEPAPVHHECRCCGRNLEADAESCPGCGGEVAGHLL